MELYNNCTNITLNSTFSANCTATTDQPFTNFEFTEPEALKWLRMFAYGLVFIFGFFGNVMVVLAFKQPKMKTVPNLFISNLAIADGVVSFVNVPLVAVHAHLSYWPYGELLCKMLPFLQGVSLAASVGIMLAIAVDRYMVIVRYDRPKLTLFKAKIWIVVIWLISCLIPSPIIAFSTTVVVPVKGVERPKCIENWPSPVALKIFSLMVFLLLYLLPLIITCILYGLIARAFRNLPTAQKVSHKAQKRIVRMFLVVVFLFALCWLPYHMVFLYMDYVLTQRTSTVISMVLFTQCLIYANSACNPIVYAVYNTNYRRQFLRMARLSCKRDYSVSSHSGHRQESTEIGRQSSCPDIETIEVETRSGPTI